MYKKHIISLFLLLFFISGCSEPIAGKYFFEEVDLLEVELRNEDWIKAKLTYDKLYKLYKENYWKLQLLGDEAEYEGIYESLHRLSSTIKSNDSTQSLLELVTIKAYLEEIYSL